MKIELEFDWDHGPDITLVIYGRRTHILTIAWSSYPVLGSSQPLRTDGILPFWFPTRYPQGGPRH